MSKQTEQTELQEFAKHLLMNLSAEPETLTQNELAWRVRIIKSLCENIVSKPVPKSKARTPRQIGKEIANTVAQLNRVYWGHDIVKYNELSHIEKLATELIK